MNDEKILVFLSRPNPFLDSHQYFSSKLQEQFDKYKTNRGQGFGSSGK